jgi:hypothetical protein
LTQAKAWERLHDASYCGVLNAEELLELAKEAGYSEDEAQKMATIRANARMDKDLPP